MPPFDFEANKTVDAIEVVPEAYRGLYADGDDGLTLSTAATQLVADYVGVSKALEKSKQDKKAASDESAQRRITTKAYDDMMLSLGLEEDNRNAEGLQTYVDGLNDQIKGGKDQRINVEKVQAQAEERIRAAVATKDEELLAKDRALHRYMIGESAAREIGEAEGQTKMLLPHVTQYAKVVREGDDYQVRVVDDQGDVRYDGAGGYMTLKSLVEEMKASDAFSTAFKSQQKSGSEMRPGSAKTITPSGQKAALTAVQNISEGLTARGVSS